MIYFLPDEYIEGAMLVVYTNRKTIIQEASFDELVRAANKLFNFQSFKMSITTEVQSLAMRLASIGIDTITMERELIHAKNKENIQVCRICPVCKNHRPASESEIGESIGCEGTD